jgi:glycosyltransferase involved in cell wall biosynthesis
MAENKPRVAIVTDWITDMGGVARVDYALHEAFPDAPIFTSVYDPDPLAEKHFRDLDVRTTWLQKLPGPLRKLHKFFPVLRVWAFRSLDLSDYDVIISSSSAESKQVRKTREDQVHICYCHTPIRYYWSHYHEYRRDPGFGWLNPLIRLLMPLIVPPMKRMDYRAAQNVDEFIANSSTVAERIEKYYDKPSTVIHPPVSIERFKPSKKRGDYFMALGRQVPYKRIDLAVAAATKLGVPLKVYGRGSEHERLVRMAGDSVEFITDASDGEVAQALNRARAFIFPAEEDFGIVQVEALAAGAPVIAYARGGTLDINTDETAVFFQEQTVESVADAIQRFEDMELDPKKLHEHAETFSKERFIEDITDFVEKNAT